MQVFWIMQINKNLENKSSPCILLPFRMSSLSRCSGAQHCFLGCSNLQSPFGSLGMYPLLDLMVWLWIWAFATSKTCALSGVFPRACGHCNLLLFLPTVHLTQTTTARQTRGRPSAVLTHPFKKSKKKKTPTTTKQTKTRSKNSVLSSVRQKSSQNWRESIVPPSKLQSLSCFSGSDVHPFHFPTSSKTWGETWIHQLSLGPSFWVHRMQIYEPECAHPHLSECGLYCQSPEWGWHGNL